MLTTLLALSLAHADPLPIKGGVGLHGLAGGTFLEMPLENEVDGYIVPAQGWGGFGGGGGLTLEGRAFDAVGLELGFFRRHDVARSTFQFDTLTTPFQVSQNAWHVPIVVKLMLPMGVLRPGVHVGGQFVMPGDPEITQPAELAVELSATSEAYKAWAFGFGFEVVPKGLPVDLRVPIGFRGAYNTGVGSAAGDRADYTFVGDTLTEVDYRTVWSWHAAVTLGVAVFFP